MKVTVKLIKKWGEYEVGDIVPCDEVKAKWLITDKKAVLAKGKNIETASLNRKADADAKATVKAKADAEAEEQAKVKAAAEAKAKSEAGAKAKTKAKTKAKAKSKAPGKK